MKKENLTPEKIQEFNNKVEYNESAASWMIDIVATLIAWPMIILAIRRRAKYHEKIKLNTCGTIITETNNKHGGIKNEKNHFNYVALNLIAVM